MGQRARRSTYGATVNKTKLGLALIDLLLVLLLAGLLVAFYH
jgi:hypothetical protein